MSRAVWKKSMCATHCDNICICRLSKYSLRRSCTSSRGQQTAASDLNVKRRPAPINRPATERGGGGVGPLTLYCDQRFALLCSFNHSGTSRFIVDNYLSSICVTAMRLTPCAFMLCSSAGTLQTAGSELKLLSL